MSGNGSSTLNTLAPLTVGVQLTLMHGGYARLREAWRQADAAGADYIFVSDHFLTPASAPNSDPDQLRGKTFEAQSILAAMAATTARSELGALVLGAGFRNPNLVADMARTIDHVAGGRYVLGLGAGWFQPDYDEYGYDFGTLADRMAAFSRYVPAVLSRLEKLNPPPVRPIPVMIGGGGEKVTLQLVAKYADIWNVGGDVETLTRKTRILDEWCDRVGRDPRSIVRSTWVGLPDCPTPDQALELGFTSLVCISTGPDWSLAGLEELLAWKAEKLGRMPAHPAPA